MNALIATNSTVAKSTLKTLTSFLIPICIICIATFETNPLFALLYLTASFPTVSRQQPFDLIFYTVAVVPTDLATRAFSNQVK